MLGNTTIKIQQARIAALTAENARLRRENSRIRTLIDLAGVDAPPEERDYGLGGGEWIDPVSGIDTWDGKHGAD
jgi:hypothetical protein